MGGAWENRVCGPGNAHAGIAWKQKAHSLCVLVEGRQLGSVQLESKLRVKRVACQAQIWRRPDEMLGFPGQMVSATLGKSVWLPQAG